MTLTLETPTTCTANPSIIKVMRLILALHSLSYRVLEHTTTIYGTEADTQVEVLWQGTDIEQLSFAYPGDDPETDPLRQQVLSGGYVFVKYTYQYSWNGTTWTNMPFDPRVSHDTLAQSLCA